MTPVRVLFGANSSSPETAWCIPLPKPNRYRVDNILFTRASPTYGDEIEAREGREGLTFRKLVKAGGRFPMIVDYPRPADFKVLVKLFRAHGVVTEGMTKGRLYLAVPRRFTATRIFELGVAKVPTLIGVHPRQGPQPKRTATPRPTPRPTPETLFDAVARNDVKAIARAPRAALLVKDADRHTLLFNATRDGKLEIVRALLARGVDPNSRPHALFAAAMRNRGREARLLLDAGAKPELAKDSDGDVALVVAAFREEMAVLRVLLTANPSVAHLTQALVEAAGVGNLSIVRLLLKHGADPDLKTRRGNTARSIAQERRQSAVLRLFHEHTRPAALEAPKGRARRQRSSG